MRIPFGVGLFSTSMWHWCLQRLQLKLHQYKELSLATKLTTISSILQASHIHYVLFGSLAIPSLANRIKSPGPLHGSNMQVKGPCQWSIDMCVLFLKARVAWV
jgi:hypothetical protein